MHHPHHVHRTRAARHRHPRRRPWPCWRPPPAPDQEDIASYPCPLVAPVRELSYMTKFEGESQDLSDTLSRPRSTRSCRP